MSGQHATVTLAPLSNDDHRRRLLIPNPINNQLAVSVGRCSRREIKKRTPAPDNAWYDSRVMSRDHCMITFNPERRNAHVCDIGSTHGTFLNGEKLITNLHTPLHNGDILRFGVDVDHGRDTFRAVEVSYKIEWPPAVIVIEDEDDDLKQKILVPPTQGRSTNTFAVPEDESDFNEGEVDFEEGESIAEDESFDGDSCLAYDLESQDGHLDHPSDDSKESIPRSWESIVLQPIQSSPASSVDKTERQEAEVDPKPEVRPTDASRVSGMDQSKTQEPDVNQKPEKEPHSAVIDLGAPDQPACATSGCLEPMVLNPVRPLTPNSPPSDNTSFFGAQLNSLESYDKFPETCYQMVPDMTFCDWKMMKPTFMRLADMAWGESDHIPDVDYENRVIHAARRCSLSQDSYLVDDDPSFEPQNGMEVTFTLEDEESDTSFHKMPGGNLKYWVVDKRQYWIIHEDSDSHAASDLWWIVEKPWDMLGDEVKEDIMNNGFIPECQKCWIVRAWEPQMVGGVWLSSPPYWDPSFSQILVSDAESVDSTDNDWDREYEETPESFDPSDAVEPPLCDIRGIFGINTRQRFDSEDSSKASANLDSAASSFDEYQYEDIRESSVSCDPSWNSEMTGNGNGSESGEYSEGSRDNSMDRTSQPYDCDWAFSDNFLASENFSGSPNVTGCRSLFHSEPLEVEGLDSQTHGSHGSLKSSTQVKTHLHGLTNPGSQFPEHGVSSKLPTSCQVKPRTFSFDHSVVPESHVYHDGPFSINTNFDKLNTAQLLSPPPTTGSMKRSASDMESSDLPDGGTPPTAEPVCLDAKIQTDSATVSAEARVAIASALAENDRPAKRVKSSHRPSSKLASHVTTAFVGALLGGLATVATLAALPNEYFA